MVDAYDYMKGYIVGPGVMLYLGMLDMSGQEVDAWPVAVYDINDHVIGTARDKQEYLTLWNASAENSAVGMLRGWYGPFTFLLIGREGATLPNYLGKGAGGGSGSRQYVWVDYDDTEILDYDNTKILLQ